MSRVSLIEQLYKKKKSALEFNYDRLWSPPIMSMFTPYDIQELYRIATSLRYASRIKEKYKMIDDVMNRRGFIKAHSGTNRVVYNCLEDPTFVAKVAIDRVGLQDTPAEFKNQEFFKPFCCKIFEVHPSGVIGFVERVNPITSIEEFYSVSDDIFNMMYTKIIGKYVVDDLGAEKFMNYGIRQDTNGYTFGPVIIDYPYAYELDGAKLICNRLIQTPQGAFPCGGEIDYDSSLSHLRCTKCGKEYKAMDLKKNTKNITIIKGDYTMRVKVYRGDDMLFDSGYTSNRTRPNGGRPKTRSEHVQQQTINERMDTIREKNETVPFNTPIVRDNNRKNNKNHDRYNGKKNHHHNNGGNYHANNNYNDNNQYYHQQTSNINKIDESVDAKSINSQEPEANVAPIATTLEQVVVINEQYNEIDDQIIPDSELNFIDNSTEQQDVNSEPIINVVPDPVEEEVPQVTAEPKDTGNVYEGSTNVSSDNHIVRRNTIGGTVTPADVKPITQATVEYHEEVDDQIIPDSELNFIDNSTEQQDVNSEPEPIVPDVVPDTVEDISNTNESIDESDTNDTVDETPEEYPHPVVNNEEQLPTVSQDTPTVTQENLPESFDDVDDEDEDDEDDNEISQFVDYHALKAITNIYEYNNNYDPFVRDISDKEYCDTVLNYMINVYGMPLINYIDNACPNWTYRMKANAIKCAMTFCLDTTLPVLLANIADVTELEQISNSNFNGDLTMGQEADWYASNRDKILDRQMAKRKKYRKNEEA